MGLFLETAIVKCDDLSLLKEKISELAVENPKFELDEGGCRYLARNGKGIQVLLSEGSVTYEDFSEKLSKKLDTWVMFLYIYDEDFWGYFLYDKGKEKDRFNPERDYFGKGDTESCKGNADIISKYFAVPKESFEKYLTAWSDEFYEEGDIFAYDKDEFAYADPWQMADFMDKLGFPYEWE